MAKRSTEKDFWKHVKIGKENECWEWKGSKDDHGYGRVRYQGKEYKSHRLAWILKSGSTEDIFVCHRCDNPPCCNPNHLFLGTHQENMDDMVKKGRYGKKRNLPKGKKHWSYLHPEKTSSCEKNGSAVLDRKKVLEIREKAKDGQSHRSIAKEYGVAKSTVTFIIQRKTWVNI